MYFGVGGFGGDKNYINTATLICFKVIVNKDVDISTDHGCKLFKLVSQIM